MTIEAKVDNLEEKIDKLITLLQNVKLENNSLRKKIASLNSENILLIDKTKHAKEAIKKLIIELQDELAE